MPNVFGIGQVLSKTRVANGVQVPATFSREGAAYTMDWYTMMALEGRSFSGPHTTGDQTYVTAQTTFANTTPTFLLSVPSGTTAIPQGLSLQQAGTVAGGAISLYIETDIINRFSSGGTTETTQNNRSDQATAIVSACTLYSNPTAVAGYGVRRYGAIGITQSVTAESPSTEFRWTPMAPIILVGPAAWLVFSVAAATAPTWAWNMTWVEFPSSYIT